MSSFRPDFSRWLRWHHLFWRISWPSLSSLRLHLGRWTNDEIRSINWIPYDKVTNNIYLDLRIPPLSLREGNANGDMGIARNIVNVGHCSGSKVKEQLGSEELTLWFHPIPEQPHAHFHNFNKKKTLGIISRVDIEDMWSSAQFEGDLRATTEIFEEKETLVRVEGEEEIEEKEGKADSNTTPMTANNYRDRGERKKR